MIDLLDQLPSSSIITFQMKKIKNFVSACILYLQNIYDLKLEIDAVLILWLNCLTLESYAYQHILVDGDLDYLTLL